jgi:hypothetical protein
VVREDPVEQCAQRRVRPHPRVHGDPPSSVLTHMTRYGREM